MGVNQKEICKSKGNIHRFFTNSKCKTKGNIQRLFTNPKCKSKGNIIWI